MRVIKSKFTNTNPQIISNRRAGAGSAFGINLNSAAGNGDVYKKAKYSRVTI